MPGPLIHGVDFTSAPPARKPITLATGRVEGTRFRLEVLEALADFPSFEAFLRRPGPWIAGFDFPFGLPRAGVESLGWPTDWTAMVRHCATMARADFRAALDADRIARPTGSRYPHRATDHAARSHSSMKLVNPPVGLMFLAGAPRLLDAGVHLPGLLAGDPQRIALEAYPGFLARTLCPRSYKSDERRKQTPERRAARVEILALLQEGSNPLGPSLDATAADIARLIEDVSGDLLDATLAALQAAWAWQRREQGFGLPADIDPLEGWIVSAPPRPPSD
ncbi:DUF429 domain-containing protein [Niveibacterium sp. SC-1]|uniref:DUF429 domain-containing protein n=1 Tax=Niveibacterium sp. SC-1 TaxID=3135646 RepID=UPI00311F62F6